MPLIIWLVTLTGAFPMMALPPISLYTHHAQTVHVKSVPQSCQGGEISVLNVAKRHFIIDTAVLPKNTSLSGVAVATQAIHANVLKLV